MWALLDQRRFGDIQKLWKAGKVTMSYITISTEAKETFSLVSNHFIDYYMTEANGEFVKVYLYLCLLYTSDAADE